MGSIWGNGVYLGGGPSVGSMWGNGVLFGGGVAPNLPPQVENIFSAGSLEEEEEGEEGGEEGGRPQRRKVGEGGTP